jgi:hypothetical protein
VAALKGLWDQAAHEHVKVVLAEKPPGLPARRGSAGAVHCMELQGESEQGISVGQLRTYKATVGTAMHALSKRLLSKLAIRKEVVHSILSSLDGICRFVQRPHDKQHR